MEETPGDSEGLSTAILAESEGLSSPLERISPATLQVFPVHLGHERRCADPKAACGHTRLQQALHTVVSCPERMSMHCCVVCMQGRLL